MVPKVELLEVLMLGGDGIEYMTVRELHEDPVLFEMRAKSLGVKLLRLRRQRLVEMKKFGKAYGYKITQKGLKRYDYFVNKRKKEEEVQKLKKRFDEECNRLLLLKAMDAKRKNEKFDVIELLKLIRSKE